METIVKIKLTPITCCSCGVVFGVSEEIETRLVNTGKSFYCINGHSQYFSQKQKEEKEVVRLREENNMLKCRVDICTKTPVYSILSTRFWRRFQDEGIKDFGQIIDLKESGLRNIYGIGDVAINEINDYLY